MGSAPGMAGVGGLRGSGTQWPGGMLGFGQRHRREGSQTGLEQALAKKVGTPWHRGSGGWRSASRPTCTGNVGPDPERPRLPEEALQASHPFSHQMPVCKRTESRDCTDIRAPCPELQHSQ